MYMAYKGRMMVQEDEIYEALEEAGKLGRDDRVPL